MQLCHLSPPKEDILIPQDCQHLCPVPEALPTDLRTILDWTADEGAAVASEAWSSSNVSSCYGCDGRSLIYLHRYLTQGGSQTVLPLPAGWFDCDETNERFVTHRTVLFSCVDRFSKNSVCDQQLPIDRAKLIWTRELKRPKFSTCTS